MSDGFTQIQGMDKALQSLRNLGSEDRVFVRKSLRKAVRAGSKVVMSMILQVVPKESGVTARSLSARAIKKRKNAVADTVGLYGSMWDVAQKFYAGWANFGHRIFSRKTAGLSKQLEWVGIDAKGRRKVRRGAKSAGFVPGRLWTKKVMLGFAKNAVETTLKSEIEKREWVA